MSNRTKQISLIIFAPLVLALLTCDVPTTEIFIIDLPDTGSIESNVGIIEINLHNDQPFPYREFISEVVSFCVVGWNINGMSGTDNIEIWISESGSFSNPELIRENCTLIFESPSISGNDSLLIDWDEAMVHIRNFPTIVNFIKLDNNFYFYILGCNDLFDLTLRASLVITIIVPKFAIDE